MSAGAHETHSAQFLLLRKYLGQLREAERGITLRLREFANQAAEDAEVQTLFASHAEATVEQEAKVSVRFADLGGTVKEENVNGDAAFPGLGPHLDQSSKTSEEQLLHNVVAAYTAECGEAAMCEYLAHLAALAGDGATEVLARDIQREALATADQMWHFLPSRSKIAFNMLTVSELDPAVETKLADDRIES